MQPTVSSNSVSSRTALNLKAAAKRNARNGVLHLCANLDYGDPARETVTLAVLTQRLGWRAMIASAGGTLVTEAERAAVKHTNMPLDSHGILSNWRNRVYLEALVQREKPVLIHAHGIDTVEMGAQISLKNRLPLVVDLTQPLPDTASTNRLLAHIAQTSCTIRVPTKTMVKHLMSTFQINPAVISVVPPGVDLQSYNPAAISAERLHNLNRLWRLPEQAIVVLMPMPMDAGMGHMPMLHALAKLKDEPIYAIMVGDDRRACGTRELLEGTVETLGLSGKVIMPEACPDWPAAFWLANVVVAANINVRGQNMELLGAQALGRPVIVTSVGANEEMVLKGETAWVLPPDNVTALAKAIGEATRLSTDQRVNLAENTRAFIEDHFPQAEWFNGMMDVYEDLMFPTGRSQQMQESATTARVA